MMHNLISLLRPRTLPLAVSVICVGNALAFAQGSWRASIFILSLLTALSLQMLSNVANDYGDGIRGTDNYRAVESPKRLTATGIVHPSDMRLYIAALIFLCLILGAWLIAISVHTQAQILFFSLLGVLSIAAAIFYTIGRCAYGYAGLGEIAVFLFFGIVGVLGSYTLQHNQLQIIQIFPAISIGLLCAAVLNINNMRDIESDKLAHKYTLAVRFGFERAKQLHIVLLMSAGIFLLIFNCLIGLKSALWLIILPLLYQHGKRILQAISPQNMTQELKPAVMLCLSISLLFSIGVIV